MSDNKHPVSPVVITRYQNQNSSEERDLVVGEEPLEIRLKFFDGIEFREKRLAVTMRTPGNDFELVVGFLLTEGIVSTYTDIAKIFYCTEVRAPEEEGNVVIVVIGKDLPIDEKIFNRNFYVSSSCGVCGKSSIESIKTQCSIFPEKELPKVDVNLIHKIPDLAVTDQGVFKHTGGLHAAALFDVRGELQLIREDVGRHNALDKLIGARSMQGSDNAESILFVSGRAGFELVQKAVMAGIPVMVAVGAPSSLAVSLAREHLLTLAGFVRNRKFNIYSGVQRIVQP